MPGRFITLEGGEGAGKTTQARHLAAALAARGRPVLLTREPGGAPGAEAIRSMLVRGDTGRWVPLAETMLVFAARAEHVARTIRPALAAGMWVVCDRYVDSTAAYQGSGQGVGDASVRVLRELVGLDPDLTLILDVDETAGLARAATRGGADRYERMGASFHARVRAAFRRIASDEPARCVLVDPSGSEDQVQARILAALAARLPA